MSKSKEELNALKKEVEAVNEKLQELTPEEIAQVNGGGIGDHPIPEQRKHRAQPNVTAAEAGFPGPDIYGRQIIGHHPHTK